MGKAAYFLGHTVAKHIQELVLYGKKRQRPVSMTPYRIKKPPLMHSLWGGRTTKFAHSVRLEATILIDFAPQSSVIYCDVNDNGQHVH